MEILGIGILRWIFAAIFAFVIVRVGLAILRGMAAPIPEPPPPGELRKVKMQFRCEMCGTEVRMTMSTNEEPEPPRHCMQEMEFVAPTME